MQGDLEAFYLRHFKAIYRVCYAFMKNAQDAEDCTEDTFVRAMTSDVSFENERHERSWLTTTAMNICKDKLKHWWRQKVSPIDEEAEQTDAEPDEKREDEIALMLCRPPSTVRNQLRDARAKLKLTLGGEDA